MINPVTLIQLKAFARQDGLFIGTLWIATFGCLMASMHNNVYNLGFLVGMIATPFVAFSRLRHFRDKVLEGAISFRRAFAFVAAMLCYASLVLAAASLIYFYFIDHGMFMQYLQNAMSMPEMKQAIAQSGLNPADLDEQITILSKARPIDFAFNIVSNGIFNALVLAAILGLFGKKKHHQQQL